MRCSALAVSVDSFFSCLGTNFARVLYRTAYVQYSTVLYSTLPVANLKSNQPTVCRARISEPTNATDGSYSPATASKASLFDHVGCWEPTAISMSRKETPGSTVLVSCSSLCVP